MSELRQGDLTSEAIYRRVMVWAQAKMSGPNANPIPAHMARTIASWWQSPGVEGCGMATYASTGTITDDLFADYEREMNSPDLDSVDRMALRAMWEVVRETEVTAWITHYAFGPYSPDPDHVHGFLSRHDAINAVIDDIDLVAEQAFHDCQCAENGTGDPCDDCSIEAHARAIMAELRTLPDTYDKAISFGLDVGNELPYVFTLAPRVMRVADFVAEYQED